MWYKFKKIITSSSFCLNGENAESDIREFFSDLYMYSLLHQWIVQKKTTKKM